MNIQFNQINKDRRKIFNLEERTIKFAEVVIDLVKTLPKNSIINPLVEQLIRSSGSIGANYYEATEAESKKDFQHKIGICKKETKETKYWLRLLAKANTEKIIELRDLWKEAHELLLIFSKILKTSKKKI